ncbi:MAG: hypothetical protein LIP02_03235 [Bacteroidales bacterium]|nr:hypothetical protein [Bacteroidales bacterium]
MKIKNQNKEVSLPKNCKLVVTNLSKESWEQRASVVVKSRTMPGENRDVILRLPTVSQMGLLPEDRIAVKLTIASDDLGNPVTTLTILPPSSREGSI